jgi:carotenoid cleavage dioxygenase-like enzyme
MFYGPGSLLVRLLWSILLTVVGYAKKLDKLRGGTANTALEFHEGRLLSLQEAALPFQLLVDPDGWISSLGYHDFGGTLKHNMTAHPKPMPDDGELRFIGNFH